MRVKKEDVGFSFGCFGVIVWVLSIMVGIDLFGFLFGLGLILLGVIFHKLYN